MPIQACKCVRYVDHGNPSRKTRKGCVIVIPNSQAQVLQRYSADAYSYSRKPNLLTKREG